MTNTNIISFDLGTKVGMYPGQGRHGYTIDLGKGDKRFFNFKNLVRDLIILHKPEVVVYESAPFQKGFATPINPGLVGVLKAVCDTAEIKYTSIPVGTIKKTFTGKGRWKEDECRAIVKEQKEKGNKQYKLSQWRKAPIMLRCDELNYTYDDDNSADAIAVYETYKEIY